VFVAALAVCTLVSALTASWLPLQVSIVTVFLFAGPHNWFEFRYFLMRLPRRFGKSRRFFFTAFTGIGLLTATYVALPFLYRIGFWSNESGLVILATWNTLLLGWLGALVWLRGKQKKTDWFWVMPILMALGAFNWWAPELFSLAIVYVHPMVALWFLDRHLSRNRRVWLPAYRRCLGALPLLLGVLIWRLSQTSALPDDNGLFWRITQHSGAALLPGVSSHLLVSVHLFLEMLHYGVWLLALPLIGKLNLDNFHLQAPGIQAQRFEPSKKIWNCKTVPLVRHPRGFPKTITGLLTLFLFLVVLLWLGFAVDYVTTRDIYFTVAIAHVLAEAPFLLKMI
jgi:hypothetical protein